MSEIPDNLARILKLELQANEVEEDEGFGERAGELNGRSKNDERYKVRLHDRGISPGYIMERTLSTIEEKEGISLTLSAIKPILVNDKSSIKSGLEVIIVASDNDGK